VLSWQIDGEWQYDPDAGHAGEIEVRFTAEGPGQTVVELEHRRLERLAQAQALYDSVGGAGGWGGVLKLFAEVVASDDGAS
jgi:hypothetical protein